MKLMYPDIYLKELIHRLIINYGDYWRGRYDDRDVRPIQDEITKIEKELEAVLQDLRDKK